MTTPASRPVAIVTGARRGIGRAIALKLAEEGYDLVVHDIEIDDQARQTESDIRSIGRECFLVEADLGKGDAAASLVNASSGHFGRIDAVVNNAATWTWSAYREAAVEDWDRMLSVDLKAPFFVGQAAAKVMSDADGGAILNISSVHRARVWPGDTIYGICKSGIARLTESMAYELGPSIRVNAIAPGLIETEMISTLDPDKRAAMIEATPIPRTGTPEEMANVVHFLLSEKASFVTAQTYVADGGRVTLP